MTDYLCIREINYLSTYVLEKEYTCKGNYDKFFNYIGIIILYDEIATQ